MLHGSDPLTQPKEGAHSMKFNDRDDIIQLTPLWTGDRFDDGRPRVSDDILRRMQYVTTEEAWGVCWNKGYQFQFEGELDQPAP